jgi:hypothetical protein
MFDIDAVIVVVGDTLLQASAARMTFSQSVDFPAVLEQVEIRRRGTRLGCGCAGKVVVAHWFSSLLLSTTLVFAPELWVVKSVVTVVYRDLRLLTWGGLHYLHLG